MDDELTSTQNEYYAAFPPLSNAWIYIAIDIRDMSMSKIGLTTKRTVQQRIDEGKTYNPFLSVFTIYNLSLCSWGTSRKELYDIESHIHNRLVFGQPIKHMYTGQDSEWFHIHPQEAECQIDSILARRGFSVNGKPLYTFYSGYNNLNDIDVEQMKKLKTICRPFACEFSEHAQMMGISHDKIVGYIDFLESFHQETNPYRVYL